MLDFRWVGRGNWSLAAHIVKQGCGRHVGVSRPFMLVGGVKNL